MINTCKTCNIEFHRPYLSDKCSNTCRPVDQSRRCGVRFNCDYCGKIAYKQKSYYLRGKKHFCNDTCRRTYFKLNKGEWIPRKKPEKTIPIREGYFDWALKYLPELRYISLTSEEYQSKIFKITEEQYQNLSKESKLAFNY